MDPFHSSVLVAATPTRQWAMDFEGNKNRILSSIYEAKKTGAKIRIGGELEITGYSCEDHFFEMDTILHSWEIIKDILDSDATDNIIVVTGMPVVFKSQTYSAAIILFNRKIIGIRPKLVLAEEGTYREGRHFVRAMPEVQNFELPGVIKKITKQATVPIGEFVLKTKDATFAILIGQEFWGLKGMHSKYYLNGVDIILDINASYAEKNKTKLRIDVLKQATLKFGGGFIYVNLIGMDGSRSYFDGQTIGSLNGNIISLNEWNHFKETDIILTSFNLHEIQQYRLAKSSLGKEKLNKFDEVQIVKIDFSTCTSSYLQPNQIISNPYDKLYTPDMEPFYFMADYLWDFLKRTKARGYFLPLSGGVDSSSVAYIILLMAELILKSINSLEGNDKLKEDVQTIVNDKNFDPKTPQEIVNKILYTSYISTSNSSHQSLSNAILVTKDTGCHFFQLNMNEIYQTFKLKVEESLKMNLKYICEGGSLIEDKALQNVQARSRMILSYLMAQLIPWHLGIQGFLLVLTATNLDEIVQGYLSKYDTSGGDINPIGDMNKSDIRQFMNKQIEKGYGAPKCILDWISTPELQPLVNGNTIQTGEKDIGLTYEEIKLLRELQKNKNCGPFSAFCELASMQKEQSLKILSDKIKGYFYNYSANRHKANILTPQIHLSAEGSDDNRFDLRPFYYNLDWIYQFQKIDEAVGEMELKNQAKTTAQQILNKQIMQMILFVFH